MKKLLLFIILFSFTFIRVNAQSYECNISGDDNIYHYDQNRSEVFYTTNLNIDITNIDSISSFKMSIEYDNNLYDLKECYLLENSIKCNNSSNLVTISYKKSSTYDLTKQLYNIKFMSNDKTPESGESKVTISFSNAKDINNNDIEINSCSKTYDFKEYDTYYVPSDDKKEELPTEDLTNTSTYISSLKIKGYEIDFDKETQEYNISVDDETNKLDISVTLESNSSKYTITGATDLNSFGNKVIITVTNTINEQREYTINVDRKIETEEKVGIIKTIKNKIKELNIKEYLPYILGGIILILLIILIVRKRNSKKMDKFLNNI